MYAGRHVGVYSIRYSLQLDESFDKQKIQWLRNGRPDDVVMLAVQISANLNVCGA